MELHSKIYADGMAPVHGYNVRSEVTSAIMDTNAFEYAYDPIGNRIESSQNSATNLYSANSLNQYTSISDLCDLCVLCGSNNVPFHYDADGNMTADERGWHYAWNGENRMVCASNDEVVVTYAYDHRGRMVRKEILPTSTNSTFSTLHSTFVWDGWNIIRETTSNLSTFQPFNFSTDYVWGLDIDGTLQGAGGVGGLLAVIRDDGVFLPAYDANGNITEYVATNGAVVAHYEYSAFGEPVVSSGELASTFTHQFSTKPYCATTGFNEYQMRKYRPAIGRWMSRDPIGEYPIVQTSSSDSSQINADYAIWLSRYIQVAYLKEDYTRFSLAIEAYLISQIIEHKSKEYTDASAKQQYPFVSNKTFELVDYLGMNSLVIGLPAAGMCAAADGPFPVGEIIGGGILVCCALGIELPDCPPPPPPPPPEIHRTPNQHGCPYAHWHYFVYHQAPWPICKISLRKNLGGCIPPKAGQPIPPSNAIEK